jgi:hypothetical protein
MNDLGSGSHIDICVIQGDKVKQWRESLNPEWKDDTGINKSDGVSTSKIDNMLQPDKEENSNNLGIKISSRGNLVNFLQKIDGDESSVIKTEIREQHYSRNTLCDVQMI